MQKAVEAASDMLATQGIQITDVELKMLIHATLAEFNNAFDKDVIAEGESKGE